VRQSARISGGGFRVPLARTEVASFELPIPLMNHSAHSVVQSDQVSSTYQDEISLLDLWDVVVRRKLLIIASLLISVVAAVAYLVVADPVYEANAKLRIGQVADSVESSAVGILSLEDPDVLSAWLLEKYGEEVATGVRRQPPFLAKIVVQKGSKTVVDLVAQGATPEQSTNFLRGVAGEVIMRHREIYNAQVDLANRRIEQIKGQRQLLAELFASSEDLLNTLKQRDPVQASLLTLERGRLATELSVTERELPAWQQKLNPPKTLMTQMIGDVAVPAKPASPKKALIISLAIVLGVMGGLMLVFVSEFVAKSRNQRANVVIR